MSSSIIVFVFYFSLGTSRGALGEERGCFVFTHFVVVVGQLPELEREESSLHFLILWMDYGFAYDFSASLKIWFVTLVVSSSGVYPYSQIWWFSKYTWPLVVFSFLDHVCIRRAGF